ncbi:hypothetical protein MKW98_019499 [Papaver atlanticum]|uniref:Uncharacterized protein n=1 Tax=Papaver atlanticum TaxID=357466 RepID=A0AAD4XA32_9MAGN|nr:hypothetical protein MKW98_019499 [Papaver atlanticum]
MVGITGNGEEVIVRTISFNRKDGEIIVRNVSFKKTDNLESNSQSDGSDTKIVMEESTRFKNWERNKLTLKTVFLFKNPFIDNDDSYYFSFTSRNKDEGSVDKKTKSPSFPEPEVMYSPRPLSELDAAAVKLQKLRSFGYFSINPAVESTRLC